MPSSAYSEYVKNLTDVHRLIVLHRRLSGPGQGRRSLGHLTRGGLLLLCAAWERYVETALLSGGEALANRLTSYNSLPETPRQKLIDHVNHNGINWTPADLSGNQWRTIYLDNMKVIIDKLHNPKYHKIKPLFDNFLGITDIGAAWTSGIDIIDDFVELRGEVAHRGGQSRYVKFPVLVKYETVVTRYVRETDNFLSDSLRLLVQPQARPWNRIL
jgi:hypothetical protein